MSVRINDELMSEVIKNPDDDGPRLKVADWLEKNDDPEWAEYVRESCEAERRPENDPERTALVDRATDLLDINRERWTTSLIGNMVPKGRFEFKRGFIEDFHGPFGQFARYGYDLGQRTPIREVVLTGRADKDEARLAAQAVSMIESLTVEDPGTDDDILIELFGDDRRSGRVRTLHVPETWVSPYGVRTVFDSRAGVAIRDLNVDFCPKLRYGSGLLFDHPVMAQMERLNVSRIGLGRWVAGILMGMKNLRWLAMDDIDLTADGMRDIVEVHTLKGLTYFSARENPLIGDDGAETLAASPGTVDLERVDLTVCGIGCRGAKAFAHSPYWGNVEALCLRMNNVGADGATALVRTGRNRPRIVDLSGNEVPKKLGAALRREAAADGRIVRFAPGGLGGEKDVYDESGTYSWHGFPQPAV